ncbi:PilZ domain-containing protein [Desulfobotulus alkaliphilus]|uniref:PilZ domain-containing protein n=1 Tax=Desulfobotulus alkaliphilus TaxID=622671 RepID=A0A562RZ02_9BACT|nr:PilZ domain-containing protein [Desulfobotulus alkaliphilus]TWI74335.1 PilZ domain-containing protein [Desulfobotulus alkaliphilus]
MEKIFVKNMNATFICPACGFSAIRDVSRFMDVKSTIHIRCLCKHCSHQYRVLLERRSFVRKSTSFTGRYKSRNNIQSQGVMTVLDISRSGLKMQILIPQKLSAGDVLELEFRLDRGSCPLIHREGIVKNILGGKTIGLEFSSSNHTDALGPYLAFL